MPLKQAREDTCRDDSLSPRASLRTGEPNEATAYTARKQPALSDTTATRLGSPPYSSRCSETKENAAETSPISENASVSDSNLYSGLKTRNPFEARFSLNVRDSLRVPTTSPPPCIMTTTGRGAGPRPLGRKTSTPNGVPPAP